MTKKIELGICCGTNCFILGGSDLLTIEEFLPDHLKKIVNVKGISCAGYCKHEEQGKAPYVLVNGKVIESANINKVIQYINNLVEQDKNDLTKKEG